MGLLALIAAGPALSQTTPTQPALFGSPTKIGFTVGQYRNPAIAVSPQGTVTVVVESGPADARRLEILEASDGGWSMARPIQPSGPGDCVHPSIAYDSSGTLHLVWAEATSGIYTVQYATFSGGQWKDHGSLSRSPDLDCDYPQLAIDRANQVWVAWQGGWATRSGIYLYIEPNDGRTTAPEPIAITGERGGSRSLHPQLFPESLYPIVWYEESGAKFQLRAAVPDVTSRSIRIVTPLDFDRLNANEEPRLFQAPLGAEPGKEPGLKLLGGIWTDLVAGRDRVLIGFQEPATLGQGRPLDQADPGNAAYPSALTVDDNARTVAAAWVSRSPLGSHLYIGKVEGNANSAPVSILRTSANGSFGRPCLAAGADRQVHCVWVSDPQHGGSGDLYYARLLF
jgi:hypothetical protein